MHPPNRMRHNPPWDNNFPNHNPRLHYGRPPFHDRRRGMYPPGGHFNPRMPHPVGYHEPMPNFRPPMGLAPLPPLRQICPPPPELPQFSKSPSPEIKEKSPVRDQSTSELVLTPDAIPLPIELPRESLPEDPASADVDPPIQKSSPVKAKANIIGKAAAKKLLKSFNFTKSLPKDKKLVKPVADDRTDIIGPPSKKKKEGKKSVIEQIRDDERRLKEALGVSELFQTTYDGLSHLNTLMDDPDAMKKFEEKGRNLREKLENKETWFLTEDRPARSRRSDSTREKLPGQSDEARRKFEDWRKSDKRRSAPSTIMEKQKHRDKPSESSKDRKYSDRSRETSSKINKTSAQSKKDALTNQSGKVKTSITDIEKKANISNKVIEKNYEQRKRVPLTESPSSWQELKNSGLSLDEVKKLDLKVNTEHETSSMKDIWIGLKTPKIFYPVSAARANDEKEKKEYRASLVRETVAKPVITYSINSEKFQFCFITRREAMLKNKGLDVWDNMERIFNGSEKILSSGPPSVKREWYSNFQTDRQFVEIQEKIWSPPSSPLPKSLVADTYSSSNEQPVSPDVNSPESQEYSVIDEVTCEDKEETLSDELKPKELSSIEENSEILKEQKLPKCEEEKKSEEILPMEEVCQETLTMKEVRSLLAKTSDKKEKKRLKRLKKTIKKSRKEKKRLRKEKKRAKKEKKKQKKLEKKKAKEAHKLQEDSKDEEIYCPFEDFDDELDSDTKVADTDLVVTKKNLDESAACEDSATLPLYSPSSPQASESNSPVPMDIDDEETLIRPTTVSIDLLSIPTPPMPQLPPPINLASIPIPQPVPPVSLTLASTPKPNQPKSDNIPSSKSVSLPIETKPVIFKLNLNKPSSSMIPKGILPGFVEDEEPVSPVVKIPLLSDEESELPLKKPETPTKVQADEILAAANKRNVSCPVSTEKDSNLPETAHESKLTSESIQTSETVQEKKDSPRDNKNPSDVSKDTPKSKASKEEVIKTNRTESSRRSSDKRSPSKSSHRSLSPRRRSRGSSPGKRPRRYSPVSKHRRSDDKRGYRSRSRSPKRRRRSRSPRRSYRSGSPRKSHRSRSRSPTHSQKARSKSPVRPVERSSNLREIVPSTTCPDLSTAPPSLTSTAFVYDQPPPVTANPFIDSSVIQSCGPNEPAFDSSSNSPKRPSLIDRLRDEHGLQVDEPCPRYDAYNQMSASNASSYEWPAQTPYNQTMDWQSTSNQQQQQVIRVGNFLQVLPQQSIPENVKPRDSSQEILSTKGLAPSLSPVQDGRVSPLPSPSPIKTPEQLKKVPLPAKETKPHVEEPQMAIPPPTGAPTVPGLSTEALLSAAAAAAAASNIPFAHLVSVLQQQNLLPSNTPPTSAPVIDSHNTTSPAPVIPPLDQIPLPEVDVEALKKASQERKARKRQQKEEKRRQRQEQRDALMNKVAPESDDENVPKEVPSIEDTAEVQTEDKLAELNDEMKPEKTGRKEPWHRSLDLPPPQKGILVIPTYTGKNCVKQKGVVFADGILPGDGTSDGEVIGCPMVDESPIKKKVKKLKKHKKAKVKPIKQYVPDNDGICSPPPPPLRPPPMDSCQLYPGWNHYTVTGPNTFVVYAQPPPEIPVMDMANCSPLQCFS